jgi:hypothetical protein
MVAIETPFLLMIGLLFLVIGFALVARIGEAKGSLRYAKAMIVMAALSVSGAFLIQVVMAFMYNPSPFDENLILKQLYVFEDMFAMLVLAFLASFAIYATYTGPWRKWVIVLIFIIALTPTTYLALDYASATVGPPLDILKQFDFVSPPLTKYFYAICGIPLGLAPVLIFARSLIAARRSGDKASTNRTAIIFSAVVANEAEYLLYVFGGMSLEIPVLVAWIPVAIFLLYAVLKITGPVRSREED